MLSFEGSEWDLIKSNGDHLTSTSYETDKLDQEMDTNELIKEMDRFASDLKLQIKQDQQLISGVRKVLKVYQLTDQ